VIYPYSLVALAHLRAEDCLSPRAGFTLVGSSASHCERRLIKFAKSGVRSGIALRLAIGYM
jgi:hypothetical protein